MPEPQPIAFTTEELRTLIGAMYDRKMESKRYRNSSETTEEPGPEDTCCEIHLYRWRRNRGVYESFAERVEFERALIEKLEASENGA